MADIHDQLAHLRDKAEAAERESIRLTTQAEEAANLRDQAKTRLTELGCSTPEEARKKAEEIEAEIKAEIATLTESLA